MNLPAGYKETTTLCPKCLGEKNTNRLWFDPMSMLMSYPPKYVLFCKNCEHREYTTMYPPLYTPMNTNTPKTPQVNSEIEIQIGDRKYTVDESYEIEFAKRQIQKLQEVQNEIYDNLVINLNPEDSKAEEGYLFDYIFNDFVNKIEKESV